MQRRSEPWTPSRTASRRHRGTGAVAATCSQRQPNWRRWHSGIQAFSTALAGGALAQLTTLELCNNKIGDPGLTALASACASGALAHLGNLYLSGNSISNKTKDTMRTAMSKSGGSVHF